MEKKEKSKMEIAFNKCAEAFFSLCGLVFRVIRLMFGWQGFVFEGNAAKVVIWKLVDGMPHVLVHRHFVRKGLQLFGGGVGVNELYDLKKGDLFAQAACRELCEELRLGTDPKDFVTEALFQQRVPVGGFFMTGCAGVLSLHFDSNYEERRPQSSWQLQKGEVKEVQWLPILEAISRTERSHPRAYVSLAYRRMLVMFLNNWRIRQRGDQPALYIGRLDRELEFCWDNIDITV